MSVAHHIIRNSNQQRPATALSVVNLTLLSWILIEEGHRDVGTGLDTIVLGVVLMVAYLMERPKGYRNRELHEATVRWLIVP